MRKNIALRALYDFANSMVMIIFLFYFSQWLVVEHGVPEIWYNVTLIAGSVLFIIFAPYLGKLVDQGASKIKGLRLRTIISIILYGIVGAMALRTPQYIVAITIIYSLALAAYLLCFVYYTPMLADLAEKQGNNAQVSGR
ncbi:hypothetical protein KBC03_03640 [Patescibacteria group bacterium]|nr:hypothetical protein [Patescibacteria group bacterium]